MLFAAIIACTSVGIPGAAEYPELAAIPDPETTDGAADPVATDCAADPAATYGTAD